MLDVYLPGTGGTAPLHYRWLTCCWLEYQGQAVLIDCGEGTQIALKKAGLKSSRLELLLITHYHADHISGLPGLLLTIGTNGRTESLTIAGPPGLRRVVAGLTVIAPNLPFPLELIELDRENPQQLQKAGLILTALYLNHKVPCFGYKAELKRKPVFNPQKAAALDIPVKLYKVLHGGEAVTLDDGRTIAPDMVLDGARSTITVCYFTDTQLTKPMHFFAKNADLLISEGMYGDDSMRDSMERKGHMLFSDSAKLAERAGVKRLWLTHFSPALPDPHHYIGAAKAIFPETTVPKDGAHICLTGE